MSDVEVSDRSEEGTTEIVPKRELKSSVLKSALKTFVLQHVTKYYETAAIRCMIREAEELWLVRRKVEAALNNDRHVVGFLSCPTALYGGNKKEAVPGLGFWVIFDWPQYGVRAFEDHLSRLCFREKMDLVSCKAVRGRGMKT